MKCPNHITNSTIEQCYNSLTHGIIPTDPLLGFGLVFFTDMMLLGIIAFMLFFAWNLIRNIGLKRIKK